ncbi:transcriptional regulator [Mangrovihabitans endophyticus]|uniref:XRE family transcriptional regulator n=1 Tax=Mangrovihabitans endophyticus TaxID=1751298 RepID=A0A8J3C8Y0_9ACTN|nr:transcriptional regulator [Mangrovihabitans endophyticus]GGL20924.1 XRE family transcriptional regulator [Mangrovihabitans endophyticus]
MNTNRSDGGPPSPTVWESPEMRRALREHNISFLFRKLKCCGFSQRRIGELTRQSQSEISEIMGGREVLAYSVLLRIADGLQIPRGYMGLGNSHRDEQTSVEDALTVWTAKTDEAEEIRAALRHAAEVTMGTAMPETERWWQPLAEPCTPTPERIGPADVAGIEHMTRILRAVDYQRGGGACREAVIAQTTHARNMMQCVCTEHVRRQLHLAIADLHNLAGWTSFDVGLHRNARRHFSLALEQTKAAKNRSLAANILYRQGRVHLHLGSMNQALRFFQLGQIAGQDANDPLTVAMLHANLAWAHAIMGNDGQALSALGRAEDEFVRGEDGLPAWVAFFGAADLSALTGMVHSLLPGDENAGKAVAGLAASVQARNDATVRSTIFELTALATTKLHIGDLRGGTADGNRAVTLAGQVRSVRTLDRLGPLLKAAREHPHDQDTTELACRIVTLRGG